MPSKIKQKIRHEWSFTMLKHCFDQYWCKKVIHFVARLIFV
ncbi:hypothetical protein HMPREF0021_01779 [Acinetobacter baumannii 6013150]|nr:hypothetical protein HMPREF0021_01779 [Acinetobacter baumannii 6013150]EGJ62902.1 hypothetical protein HMPREF0020_03536 [Acinetobacter baumannii 6013113]